MTRISTCIITLNCDKTLEICLKSIKHFSDEIVIVDGGSTDNTIDIAKKYADKVFIHKWENNFALQRNKAFQYAKGDWIFIIDSDEFVGNNFGNKMRELIANHKYIGYLFPRAWIIKADDIFHFDRQYTESNPLNPPLQKGEIREGLRRGEFKEGGRQPDRKVSGKTCQTDIPGYITAPPFNQVCMRMIQKNIVNKFQFIAPVHEELMHEFYPDVGRGRFAVTRTLPIYHLCLLKSREERLNTVKYYESLKTNGGMPELYLYEDYNYETELLDTTNMPDYALEFINAKTCLKEREVVKI